jgi:hypothetical protein
MSTTSQRIGLKIPDGSDPFLRTDFVENYTTLDQYPGTWICTSATRPAWGAEQAGMRIIETDTRREMMWSGTAFRELLTSPQVWTGSLRPLASIGYQTTANFTIGTFTTTRPGTLVVLLSTQYSLPNRGSQAAATFPLIDNAVSSFDTSNVENVGTSFPDTSTFGSGHWTVTVPTLGSRVLSPGTHSVGVRVSGATTSGNTATINLVGTRVLAILCNTSDR